MPHLHDNDKKQPKSRAAANSPHFQQEGIASFTPPPFRVTADPIPQMKENEEEKAEALQKKENDKIAGGDATPPNPNEHILTTLQQKHNAYRPEPKQYKRYELPAQKKQVQQFKEYEPFQLKDPGAYQKSQGDHLQEVQAKMENTMGHDEIDPTTFTLEDISKKEISVYIQSLSVSEMSEFYHKVKDVEAKACLLEMLQENNPYKSYLGKTFKVNANASIHDRKNEGSTHVFSKKSGTRGYNYAVDTPIIPKNAIVEILETAQHLGEDDKTREVAKIKIRSVPSEEDKAEWQGKKIWTTRTNISSEKDGEYYKIVKPDANVRKAPAPLNGDLTAPNGTVVYVVDAVMDNDSDQNPYALCKDAKTHLELGWINPTNFEGKMYNETIGVQKAIYDSEQSNPSSSKYDTKFKLVGKANASIRQLVGPHFATTKSIIDKGTKVKIVEEKEHFNHNDSTTTYKVAKITDESGNELGWTTRSNISKVAEDGVFEIIKGDANIRNNPINLYKTTGSVLEQGARIVSGREITGGSKTSGKSLVEQTYVYVKVAKYDEATKKYR